MIKSSLSWGFFLLYYNRFQNYKSTIKQPQSITMTNFIDPPTKNEQNEQ